jgi:DNA-directed RNA polymerase subunit RPC12/RpoP
MEDEKYPYQKQWKSYRFTIRLGLIIISVGLLLHFLLVIKPAFIPENVLVSLVVMFWMVFIGINFRMIFWSCPRCRRFYFQWWRKINLLKDYECRHCGLKKYEGADFKGKRFGKKFGF